jgi:hypothetical protein
MTLQNCLCSRFGRCLSFGLFLLGISTSASADVIYYTDESSFQAAVNNLTLESFEAAFGPSPTLTFGDVSITETSALAELWTTSAPTKVTNGQYAIEVFADGPSTVTFNFAEPMSAFGIHITSFGTTGPGTLTVSDNSGATTPQILATSNPLLPPLNDVFFGIHNTDAAFTQITFSMTTTADSVAFDGLRSCPETAAVPEPHTALLVGAALTFFAARRIRRR